MEQKQLELMRSKIRALSGIIVLLVAALCFAGIYIVNHQYANQQPAEIPAATEA